MYFLQLQAMHSCDTTILIPQEDEASMELELLQKQIKTSKQAAC